MVDGIRRRRDARVRTGVGSRSLDATLAGKSALLFLLSLLILSLPVGKSGFFDCVLL
jgi:hypothetical protein